MKIGVIGIGGIAQKAYLPTYTKIRKEADFIFATRNSDVRKALVEEHHFETVVETIDQLLTQKIEACFIHAATRVHFELAKKCLEAGVAVFIDKPVSEDFQEVHLLQKLAEEKNLLFMVGFNRRFAPMVDQLKQLTQKRVIHLEKNEPDHAMAVQYGIYDLFIHLVDTAVYLLDDEIMSVHSKIREENGQMVYAQMQLSTATSECLLSMDLMSGGKMERYQVNSPKQTMILEQLTDLTIKRGQKEEVQRFGDWTTTLEKRGFEQLVLQFIAALKGKDVDLRQADVSLSHELCEQMLQQHIRHQL
ncbi:Gfo/Idh/MocA family protein [Enterococcus xiangfangensis]|uniref:Gfo/Idh/MocA family oxidoreductase n=1 Tax=Enterococcus xiangfangensis TaxID=1296537 RepID=A0ABU3FA46_9ENTE|nr:Gfo/Idh/MocA family oxidoreductase [Enterococcus xiangfangensis]MDT2759557.1 Gfo/Idh/MocA family oxidoreductase [Enterococcus xiangfangensis]